MVLRQRWSTETEIEIVRVNGALPLGWKWSGGSATGGTALVERDRYVSETVTKLSHGFGESGTVAVTVTSNHDKLTKDPHPRVAGAFHALHDSADAAHVPMGRGRRFRSGSHDEQDDVPWNG